MPGCRSSADGTERFYARYTDPRGRHVVKPPDGDSTWPDWGEAFTAGCVAQIDAERLSYRSRDGERLLFQDLVRHHYLPSLRDASPNTRKNTASHLGDGSGVPTRNSPTGQRAARSQLLFAFGHLPIGGIGPSEVQQWISQMGADGYDVSTVRAKRSLLRSILRVAGDQGWTCSTVTAATPVTSGSAKPSPGPAARTAAVTSRGWSAPPRARTPQGRGVGAGVRPAAAISRGARAPGAFARVRLPAQPTALRRRPHRSIGANLQRLVHCFDDPVDNPGRRRRGVSSGTERWVMAYDLWVDFQRMQDDGRLLARTRNAQAGLTITAGMHLLVGCEDAEPAVAQVLSVAAEGSIELRVLPGAAADHLALVQSVS